ncbi:pentapeptide repeat-containing protein [Streptomyces olivaceus]|uniref:pentapeptide repeat-containing protein n=1 Tax=Streptomyces olivaceus TaxID=47716 RepID=UPI0004C951CA|nr:pentapeptide repeat-containing protein [Streptomyces olivaceus]MBZ6108007.1 hypothetical protein [Streptomyces olivaceus]
MTFQTIADFRAVTFQTIADFQAVTFQGNARFGSATFQGYAFGWDCKSFGVTPDHGGCIDDQ